MAELNEEGVCFGALEKGSVMNLPRYLVMEELSFVDVPTKVAREDDHIKIDDVELYPREVAEIIRFPAVESIKRVLL